MSTTTQTVRDIAMENRAAVRVFEKYGIDYCCGGRVPLAEACAARNLNVDEVIASLGTTAAASTPGYRDWVKESLASLTAHIVDAHHAYVTREVPRLNELAAKVVNRHGDTREELPVLQSKLAELGEELISHQGKEEVVLFPYIGKLERYASGNGTQPRNCFGSISHPIAMMTKDHEIAGNLMAEIRNLSQDYRPPEGACPTFRAFYAGLEEFEQDLHQHIHLENNILFPRAIALENSAA
ncbi:MAG TPA: iron-sulfur cluster repair di-iron protein [Terracidiphilus sp.]|nr:iron-sulfur cluster repair di-iron protein [Terracidiphilus sp.]